MKQETKQGLTFFTFACIAIAEPLTVTALIIQVVVCVVLGTYLLLQSKYEHQNRNVTL